MLKSKVAYACPSSGRDRKVPEEFRKYIEEMVDNIENWKDFNAFALCFVAVVGYFFGEVSLLSGSLMPCRYKYPFQFLHLVIILSPLPFFHGHIAKKWINLANIRTSDLLDS